MRPRFAAALLSLVATLLLDSGAQAQVSPDKALSTFTVAKGLELSLWASEPLLANPTCMDIDHKGRIWVCESVNYRTQLRSRPLNRAAGDRILILEDTRGAGRADKVTTFYQSPELLAPIGIAVAKEPVGPGYKVYVCQSPDILLFEDKDGDGHADGPPKKLLSGFKGIDHDHGVHGISIGPDNRLYFSVGDQGVDGLLDKNGKTWKTNRSDCQAGTIWRCDLDGKNLEFIAHNFRNEYEPCVDSFGTIFVSDNDDDGKQQTRICYVMPGGNYGYWPRGAGQTHWHEEQPGVVHKILRTYFGSPTGICVYEGTLLPEAYRGQLLHTDAGPRQVRCYHLTPQGAGYSARQEELVTSTDGWFRPSDICVAPDGSLYISDWYDPGVGGHGMGDTTRGRIYRLAPVGNKPSTPSVDLESAAGLHEALASPALSVRAMAMAKLNTMPVGDATRLLTSILRDEKRPWVRARAAWQMARLTPKHHMPPGEYLPDDPDPRFRQLAARIEKEVRGQVTIPSVEQLDSTVARMDLATAREALLLLRDADPHKIKPYFLALANKYDGKDRFYLNALGIAVGNDPSRREILLGDFEKHFPDWNEKVASLVWELRPPGVLPRLEQRLVDPALPASQRAQIVDIVASTDGNNGCKVLLKVLDSDPPSAVRQRIVDQLLLYLPGKWSSLQKSPELKSVVDRLLAQSPTRQAGLSVVAAAGLDEAIPRVAAIAADSHSAAEERRIAIATLGAFRSRPATQALVEMLKEQPAAVRLEAVKALGRQLQETGPQKDPGQVLTVLQGLLRDEKGDADLRLAAATALAESRHGGLWLLEENERAGLPGEVKATVARILRNSPYKGLQNKALLAFPVSAKLDPAKLPTLSALAARHGDVSRGMKLWLASAKNDAQCMKCHTVDGKGGQIGPDLSAIGKKASRENLFESILFPSKAIADQFVTWIVETKTGTVLSGLLVEDTPEKVTIRDANGKDTSIPKKDIESRTKSPTSLMPADLIRFLTEEDLVDLVEYMLTLKSGN